MVLPPPYRQIWEERLLRRTDTDHALLGNEKTHTWRRPGGNLSATHTPAICTHTHTDLAETSSNTSLELRQNFDQKLINVEVSPPPPAQATLHRSLVQCAVLVLEGGGGGVLMMS